eukprot:scaffold175580_cov21-Tisochrysis_lutea.AAC.1
MLPSLHEHSLILFTLKLSPRLYLGLPWGLRRNIAGFYERGIAPKHKAIDPCGPRYGKAGQAKHHVLKPNIMCSMESTAHRPGIRDSCPPRCSNPDLSDACMPKGTHSMKSTAHRPGIRDCCSPKCSKAAGNPDLSDACMPKVTHPMKGIAYRPEMRDLWPPRCCKAAGSPDLSDAAVAACSRLQVSHAPWSGAQRAGRVHCISTHMHTAHVSDSALLLAASPKLFMLPCHEWSMRLEPTAPVHIYAQCMPAIQHFAAYGQLCRMPVIQRFVACGQLAYFSWDHVVCEACGEGQIWARTTVCMCRGLNMGKNSSMRLGFDMGKHYGMRLG